MPQVKRTPPTMRTAATRVRNRDNRSQPSLASGWIGRPMPFLPESYDGNINSLVPNVKDR